MERISFSIVVVCLNPGNKLLSTVDSVLGQRYGNYEIVVKDGGSDDGSVEKLPADPRIRLTVCKDGGIYEAMNQALPLVRGQYVCFLNCGDLFYDNRVLEATARAAEEEIGRGHEEIPRIFYGNQYNEKQGCLVYSAPVIDDFTCYRNVPCHQVCFYDRRLFADRGYDTLYRVRADYEHFLYCRYRRGARAVSTGVTVVKYEGGGFSETRENRKRSKREHREIVTAYLGRKKVVLYRLCMLLSLAPLRTRLAESRYFSGIYNGLKRMAYHRSGSKKEKSA